MKKNVSSTIQNDSIELEELLKGIEAKKYIIPEFQRNFVWNRTNIVNLADSIIREYPISSILLMKTGGNLVIPGKILAFNQRVAGNEEGVEGYYVLDGQQRLTALSEIFLGQNSDKDYYFDLLTMLYELFPEDNILEYYFYSNTKKNKTEKFIDLIKKNNQFKGIDDLFCRTFSKSDDNVVSKQMSRYLSAREVFKNNYIFTISNFLNNIVNIDDSKKNHYVNVLNTIFSKVNRYRIATTEISKDADLGLVIRIFEKINSYGVKLSLFDLINAKTFAVSNEGLGKVLTADIQTYLNKNNIPDSLFNKIFNFSVKENIYLNLGRIVRILEMLSLLEKKEPIILLVSSKMLNKEPMFWFKQWNKYKDRILNFMKHFATEEITDFVSLVGIEYFCAIYSFHTLKDENLFIEMIEKVLLSANFKELGFNKSNLSLFKDFINFAEYLSDTSAFNFSKYQNESYLRIKKYIQNNVSELDDITNIPYSKKNYKFNTLMYLIYKKNVKGYGLLDLENNKTNTVSNKDYHHIFPLSQSKSYSKDLQEIINSVANIALLDSNSNRFSIKDKKFENYMKEILDSFGIEKFKEILSLNLLDFELVLKYIDNPSEDLIKEILNKRMKTIIEIVKYYFNT